MGGVGEWLVGDRNESVVVFVAVVPVSGCVGESLVGDQNESDVVAIGCTDSTGVSVLFDGVGIAGSADIKNVL